MRDVASAGTAALAEAALIAGLNSFQAYANIRDGEFSEREIRVQRATRVGEPATWPKKHHPHRRRRIHRGLVLSRAGRVLPSIPLALPPDGHWLVRVTKSQGRFIFGEYRRHMKTIGYLGQLDKLFAGKATTRNWNTILTIVRILKDSGKADR